MRKVFAVAGDTHINSISALCPPVVTRDDGDDHHQSPIQRAIWKAWVSDWKAVKEFANGDKVNGLFMGDMIEADAKKRDAVVISKNANDIIRIAGDVMEIPYQIIDRGYFLRGTEAHVGPAAQWDEALASDCDVAIPSRRGKDDDDEKKRSGIYSHWTLKFNIDGYRIFAAHHPPSLANPKNAAKKIRDAYYSHGEQPPDLAIFAHVHHCEDSGALGSILPRVISTPCYQAATPYTQRIAIYDAPQIGLLYFAINNGKLEGDIHARIHDLPKEREIRI